MHHVNLLVISNSEGKFYYLVVRNLFALVNGRTTHNGYTHLFHYYLYCFSEARLLTAHLPDCSVHSEQNVKNISPDDLKKNIKQLKAIAKTLLVPFVLYADFESFLVAADRKHTERFEHKGTATLQA